MLKNLIIINLRIYKGKATKENGIRNDMLYELNII